MADTLIALAKKRALSEGISEEEWDNWNNSTLSKAKLADSAEQQRQAAAQQKAIEQAAAAQLEREYQAKQAEQQKAAEQAAYANLLKSQKNTTLEKLLSADNAAAQKEALQRYQLDLKTNITNPYYTGYAKSFDPERVKNAVVGTAKGMPASIQTFYDSAKQMVKDSEASDKYTTAMGKWSEAKKGIELYDGEGDVSYETLMKLATPEDMASGGTMYTKPLNNAREKIREAQADMSKYGTVLTKENSKGMKKLAEAKEIQQKALEGLDPATAWLTQQAMSVGQNLPTIVISTIPGMQGVGLALMGAIAAGDKAYEVSQKGGSAGEAFTRGAIAGGIEVATEIVSLDNIISIVKGEAKAPIKWVTNLVQNPAVQVALSNILRQMGYEASEEMASYIANYAYDKYVADPEAKFSLKELFGAGLGGAFSALILGGLGTIVNTGYTSVNNTITKNSLTEKGVSLKEASELAPIVNKMASLAENITADEAKKVFGNETALQMVRNSIAKTQNGQEYLAKMMEEQNAQETTSEAPAATAVPTTPTAANVEDIRSSLVEAGTTEEVASKLAPIVEKIINGEVVSEDERAMVAENDAAMSIVTSAIEQNRKGLASPNSTADTVQSGNLPAEQQSAVQGELGASATAPVNQTAGETDSDGGSGAENDYSGDTRGTGEGNTSGSDQSEMQSMYEERTREVQQISERNSEGYTNEQKELRGVPTKVTDTDTDIYNELTKDLGNESQTRTRRESTNAKAGLVENNNSRRINRRTRRILDTFARRTGITIELVDDIPGDNGRYLPESRTLQISMKSDNPLVTVFTHEVTHRLKETSPAEYQRFAEIALGQMRDNGNLNNAAQMIKDAYGGFINNELLRDELTAGYARSLCNDISAFEELVGIDRSLAQKLLDTLDSLIHDIGLESLGNINYTRAENRIFGTEDLTDYQLSELREAWAAALKNSNAQTEGENSNIRESKKLGKWADINIDKDSEINKFNLRGLNDYIHVQKTVYQTLKNEGFFSDGNNRRKVKNADTGIEVEIGRDGINETFGKGNRYSNLPRELKEFKLATVRSLPNIIKYGEVVDSNVNNYHNDKSNLQYSYIEHPVIINGKPYYVIVDIRQSLEKNKFWMHGIYINSKSQSLDANSANTESAINKGKASTNNTITELQQGQENNSSARESRKISQELLEKYGLYSQQSREINGNVRSTEYQNRARNRLVKRIGDAFSVPTNVRDTFNDSIAAIDKAIESYGRPTVTEVRKLFDEAIDKGIVTLKGYSEQYEGLKKELRDTRIKVTDTIKGDITDYNKFKKDNFGRLNLANEGSNVDAYYEELSERYPELFPQSIINPTDQLMKISEVAKSFKDIEIELKRYAEGDDQLIGYLRSQFEKAVNKYTDDSLKAIRYEVEKTALNEEAEIREQLTEDVLNDRDELKKAEKRLTELKREIDKAKRKTLLSPRDSKAIKALAEGLIDKAPEGPNAEAVTEIAEMQKEYNELKKLRDENKKRAKAAYRKAAEVLAANSDTWKDPKAGISLSTTTPERALYRITGNRTEAQRLIDSLIVPIHSSEAERIRRINEITEAIKSLDLDTEKKYKVELEDKYGGVQTVSESGLVQLYGEGLIDESTLKKLGADVDKVKASSDAFRAVYNELFEDLEKTLLRNGYDAPQYRKDYFPHFDETAEAGSILALAAKLTGVDVSDATLPTNLAGITEGFKPGKPWMRNLNERKGTRTSYDALEGLQKYLTAATNVIYHTDNIQRLRAFEDVLRYKYSDQGKQEMLDNLMDEDLGQEEYDARRAEITGRNIRALPNFVTWLREYTNILAGKKSLSDRKAEQELSRGFYSMVAAIENRVAANMIAGNMSSSLTNFIPIFQVSSYEVTPKNMAKAMKMVITDKTSTDALALKSDFLTNRKGADSLKPKTKLERAAEIAGKPMEAIDAFTSQTLTIGRYLQNIENAQKNGQEVDYDAAMKEADSWAASVMADRSKGAKPTIFEEKNPLTKVFTMFQVEVNNQLQHYFEDLPREFRSGDKKMTKAEIAKFSTALTQKLLQTCAYGLLFKMIFGYDPTFNPFAIIYRFFKDLFKDEKTLWDAATAAGEDLAQDLPFIGGVLGGGRVPIKSALPDWDDLRRALEKGSDPKSVKQNLYEGLKPTLFTLLPPFGGNQARKTYEGLSTVAKGGSYTYDSKGQKKLKYAVEQTPLNYVRGALAGKWAFPEAQEYIDNGFKSMSVKQTKTLDALAALDSNKKNNLDNYTNYKDYLSSVDADGNGSTTNAEKKKALADTKFNYEKKAEIYFSGSDSAYEKYKKALEKGIEAEAYYKLMTTADADENGAIDRAERQKAVEALNLPKKETAELYFYSGSDKSYNNYQEALARDIDGYVYYKYITDADADKNGYLKQAEATAYLDLLKNVTKSQKYFMWMAGTGAKTDKNNPYK